MGLMHFMMHTLAVRSTNVLVGDMQFPIMQPSTSWLIVRSKP